MKARRTRRDERLTSDITIAGRMPTPLEYKRHLEALEAVDHDERAYAQMRIGKTRGRLWGRWIGVDLNDIDYSVWKAIHQQGLVRRNADGLERLTEYGKIYLRQRTGAAARDPKRSKALAGARPGLKAVAQRTINAEERFLDYAQERAGLTRTEALRALAAYKKARAIKIDRIVGQFTFTHGGFGDVDVLRRAAGR